LGDEDKKLERLEVDPREKERNNNILFFLKMFAQTHNMTPSMFSFEPERMSGAAKFHDKQPEIEYREDMVHLLAPVEIEEIWPMLKALAMVAGYKQADLLSELELAVDFPKQMIPLSREEELKNVEREIKLGLTSPGDVVAEEKGLNQTEAEQEVHASLEFGRPRPESLNPQP